MGEVLDKVLIVIMIPHKADQILLVIVIGILQFRYKEQFSVRSAISLILGSHCLTSIVQHRIRGSAQALIPGLICSRVCEEFLNFVCSK